jgi:hypothetical protein
MMADGKVITMVERTKMRILSTNERPAEDILSSVYIQ